MRRLTHFYEQWRNYLYAYKDGAYNDVNDLIIRINIINNSHEQLLEAMLCKEPNMELVEDCRTEILYQKETLEDLVNEFVEYFNNSNKEKIEKDYILEGVAKEGNQNDLYIIAEEWREWGEKANRIWSKLNDNYDQLNSLQDDLCKMIMDEVYGKQQK